MRESSGPLEGRLSMRCSRDQLRQAAGERRGEGEPVLDRRSAPSHPH